ncbi:MAG: hypothetical protein ACLGGX_11430 [Bdellovibrionia bacterium]
MQIVTHLRQISFTHHSWQDMHAVGLTPQPLASENHGIRKNILLMSKANSETQIALHHWMLVDEEKAPLSRQDMAIAILPDLTVAETLHSSFELSYFLVKDEYTKSWLESFGLLAQLCNTQLQHDYFLIRKNSPIWAAVGRCNLNHDKVSTQVLNKNADGFWHFHSESNCIDFVIL